VIHATLKSRLNSWIGFKNVVVSEGNKIFAVFSVWTVNPSGIFIVPVAVEEFTSAEEVIARIPEEFLVWPVVGRTVQAVKDRKEARVEPAAVARNCSWAQVVALNLVIVEILMSRI
jgi:hypothetical protein